MNSIELPLRGVLLCASELFAGGGAVLIFNRVPLRGVLLCVSELFAGGGAVAADQ